MLQVKDAIKNKLCLLEIRPNYPLGDLVEWIDTLKISASFLIQLLDEIQTELDAEATILSASTFPHDPQILMTKRYWCLYCAQVRSYYSAICRDPENEKRLWFLLW